MDKSGGYTAFPFVAEFYDDTVPYNERGDVAFFVEASGAAGGKTLEIGCGTGRVLIPTARAGFEIVGMDLSTVMLDICRAKLVQEPPEVQQRVRLEIADMRDFDMDEQFGLVTLPFRPFQHLETVEDQMSCLEAVSKGTIVVAWGRALSPARQYGRRKAARYAVLETEHINSGKDDVLKTEF